MALFVASTDASSSLRHAYFSGLKAGSWQLSGLFLKPFAAVSKLIVTIKQ